MSIQNTEIAVIRVYAQKIKVNFMDNIQTAIIIKKLCKKNKVSINAMLEACDVNRNFIYDLEKRNSVPSVDVIERIADYFNLSVDYLISRSNDNTPFNYESEFENTFKERLNKYLITHDKEPFIIANIDYELLLDITEERKKLTFDIACSIADKLGCSLDYLSGLSDDE